MATEGGHTSEYDPRLTPKLAAEAARVIRGFSFAGAHVIIVGGLVPSLLVPHPEPEHEFSSIDAAGAVKHARFMAEDTSSRERLARRAIGALAVLLRGLGG